MAIDDIVSRIASDAEAEAQELLAAARADAERAVAEATERADARAALALSRAKAAAEREASTVLAAARLAARDKMLSARQRADADALDRVEAALVALPDADYASLIARELARTSLPSGELRIGTEDVERLRGVLPAALAAEGVTVSVGEQAADIARGVVLVGDRVRVEVSPASMVEARRSDLEAEIDRGLFGEEA